MKRMKQITSLILTFAFIFGGWLSVIDVASAAESEGYTYTIKIILGGTGNEGASFVSTTGDCLTFTGYGYGDTFTFNPKDEVKITPQATVDEAGNETVFSKYYVKGMRRSGDNSLAESSFKVTKDDTYVIAYGVGAVVPYTVRFVDTSGNALLDDATYYGAEGEEVVVPSRYIDGYTPDKLNCPIPSLKENQIVTFVYSKNVTGGDTIYNTSERINYTTVPGEATQVTQTVPAGQPQVVNGVTNNRDQNAGQNTAGGAGEGAAGGAADTTQIDESDVPLAGDGSTSIPDTDTPKSGESTTIPEPEPPKGGEDNPTHITYIRYLFLIAILGILIILIALIVTYKLEKEKNRKTK